MLVNKVLCRLPHGTDEVLARVIIEIVLDEIGYREAQTSTYIEEYYRNDEDYANHQERQAIKLAKHFMNENAKFHVARNGNTISVKFAVITK
jgi:hypothetical protein